MDRKAKVTRKTYETDIEIDLNLDGSGLFDINTGIGFFDHMLSQIAKHGLLDLMVLAKGDLHIDSHHTIEDVGIVLGQCIRQALGDKSGIQRYGTAFVPMDESLAQVTLDVSGRPFLVFDATFTSDIVGTFQTEMIEEFFRALAFNAEITLHGKILYGKNNHHKIEALCKALGRALSEAIALNSRIKGIQSTKGTL